MWIPYILHGIVGTWWYVIQGGLLQNILVISGKLISGINFLPLFYVGIFIDELLLLVGVWLLGRRFFVSTYTVLFVALAIMGSCIWVLQPWWNFHLYYAVPLILYFIHEFIDSGKWRHLFLGGNLLLIQSLGNLPYFLPLISLTIFLYFLFYLGLTFKETFWKIRALRFGWPSFLVMTALAGLFFCLYFVMRFGTDQLVNYSHRAPDGGASLNLFLSYGGKICWKAWLELLLGISFGLDYTLYIGVICFPFIVFGLLFNQNKTNMHFLFMVIILLLFSMGTIVSVFFYYCWPMMNFFRHLALISPLIKVFICFVAGFGFDAIFYKKPNRKKSIGEKASLIGMSLFMFGVSASLWLLSINYPDNYHFFVKLVEYMIPRQLPVNNELFDRDLIPMLLMRTSFFAMAASILLVSIFLIKREKYLTPFIVILLILHGGDIYGFKFLEVSQKSVPLTDKLYKIINFQAMPYSRNRDTSFETNNSRAELLKSLPFLAPGVLNFSTHAFLFKDELGNSLRINFGLYPLDQYMRAYWGQPIHDLSVKLRGLVYPSMFVLPRLEFPREHPAALKISGVTEDKIQFFQEAEIVPSDDLIASYITDPNYKGDMIFLSPQKEIKSGIPVSISPLSGNALTKNNRLHLPYQILKFDSNDLTITIQNNEAKPAWLLYSDVWHPFWRVTVNGQKTKVYKANLAYKVVKLSKGFNKVHFYYKSQLFSALSVIFWNKFLLLADVDSCHVGKNFILPGYVTKWFRRG